MIRIRQGKEMDKTLKIDSATAIAHHLLSCLVKEGDTVIDATAGNGRDTCFLAGLVGEKGEVWAFDIQEEACARTKALLEEAGLMSRVHILCRSHDTLAENVVKRPKAVLFNLGYLPGGDHQIRTEGEVTLQAVKAASEILAEDGIIIVVAYIGHDGGYEETLLVEGFIHRLPPRDWRTLKIGFPNKNQSPLVLAAQRC